MIAQRVRVVKKTTEDGLVSLVGEEADIKGKDGWVYPTTIQFSTKASRGRQRWCVALAEDQSFYIPVELLEFTNEFKVV